MEKVSKTEHTENPAELRSAIDRHILAMLQRATDAMRDLFFLYGMMELNTPWLLDDDIEQGEKKDQARPSTDILDMEKGKDLQEIMSAFLAEDYQEPEETVGLEIFLFAGIRYYQKTLNDDSFFIMSDLPELFIVDERMGSIFTALKSRAMISQRVLKNAARLKKSTKTIINEAKISEQETIRLLQEIKDTDELTITNWARKIEQNHTRNIKLQTITNTIRKHFGKNLTKPPRAKYTISEILS